MPRTIVAAIVVVTAALAGCVGNTEDPRDFTVTNTSSLAEQANVTEPFTLVVHVRQESDVGPAVEGAGVVFFTSTTRASEWDANFTHTDHEPIATATTDEDGLVFARLAPGETISVAAGGLDGLTTELRPNVLLGAPGEQGHVSIALYQERFQLVAPGAVDLDQSVGALDSDANGPEYIRTPLVFHEDPDINAAYLERLQHLDVALRWNNTQTSWADLAVGLAPSDADPVVESDEADQGLLDANNEERVTLDRGGLGSMDGAYLDAGGVDALVRIDRAGAAQDLHYAIAAQAQFAGADVIVRV